MTKSEATLECCRQAESSSVYHVTKSEATLECCRQAESSSVYHLTKSEATLECCRQAESSSVYHLTKSEATLECCRQAESSSVYHLTKSDANWSAKLYMPSDLLTHWQYNSTYFPWLHNMSLQVNIRTSNLDCSTTTQQFLLIC